MNPRRLETHLSYLENKLRNPGDNIIYPWGTIDHQIYIHFWRLSSGEYRVTIFNLGNGRFDRPILNQYLPIEKHLTSEKLKYFIRLLVTNYNKPSSPDLFAKIYGEDAQFCNTCTPEFMQTTGNCVVKNLLAVIKQDAIYRYGENYAREIFKTFYLLLVKASLIKANENAVMIDTRFPNIEKIMDHIERSQSAFIGVSKKDIIKGLMPEYGKLQLNCSALVPTISVKNDEKKDCQYLANNPNSMWFFGGAVAVIGISALLIIAAVANSGNGNQGQSRPSRNGPR